MRPPSPLVRGQGNEPFRTADPKSAAKRGQTIPYDVNGSPAGGDAATLGGQGGAHYLARANHTGTQFAASISDLAESVQDLVGVMVAAGANISVAYNDGAGTLTIALATSPALAGTPTAPTASPGTNTTQIATTAYVQAAVASLINSAPGALDTLDELAAALGDDANFASTMTAALAGKQASDALLTSIAGLTFGSDSFIYGTGSDTAAAGTITTFGRSLVDDVNAVTARATLGLVIGTDVLPVNNAAPTGTMTLGTGGAALTLAQPSGYTTIATNFALRNGVTGFAGRMFLDVGRLVIRTGDVGDVGEMQARRYYDAGGTQVVTTRATGWGAPTGTATRTTFATGSVTLPQLAERVKALVDDLTTHGLIGA